MKISQTCAKKYFAQRVFLIKKPTAQKCSEYVMKLLKIVQKNIWAVDFMFTLKTSKNVTPVSPKQRKKWNKIEYI